MSMPDAFQSLSSALLVPELSPREMKSAFLFMMVVSALPTSFMPLMPAGSLFGPTTTKSLYITGWRGPP